MIEQDLYYSVLYILSGEKRQGNRIHDSKPNYNRQCRYIEKLSDKFTGNFVEFSIYLVLKDYVNANILFILICLETIRKHWRPWRELLEFTIEPCADSDQTLDHYC